MTSIDSCEYIWEAGVGFAHSPTHNHTHDQNRTEIIKLLLTCFSETMYLPPVGKCLHSFFISPNFMHMKIKSDAQDTCFRIMNPEIIHLIKKKNNEPIVLIMRFPSVSKGR